MRPAAVSAAATDAAILPKILSSKAFEAAAFCASCISAITVANSVTEAEYSRIAPIDSLPVNFSILGKPKNSGTCVPVIFLLLPPALVVPPTPIPASNIIIS